MSRGKARQLLRFAFDTEGELLELSLQILMQTGFLGGGKGSGKTTALKKLFEAAHEAGAQCGAVATLGKWWSLRISKTGKRKGLADVFIFGGKYGDVQVTRDSGRAVARTVVAKRIHFVLDVETMRKADRIVFLADFLEELSLLKKNEEQPPSLVLFIDEMQNVAPQKSRGADSERLKEAAADLARECRNYGMGLWASAQRVANVDKDYIGLVDALIVMRTTWSGDRKVYKDWVDEKGGGDEDDYAWIKKLRRLEKGQGYLHLPEQNIFQRVVMKMIDTFDATKTATVGERVTQVGRLSKLDVKRLGDELSAVVAESEANDPKLLRAKIAKLEHELAAKPKGYVAKATVEIKQSKPPKIDKRALKRIQREGKKAFETGAAIARTATRLTEIVQEFAKSAAKLAPALPVIKPGYAIGVSADSATPVRVALVGRERLAERLASPEMRVAVDKARAKLDAQDGEVKLGRGERLIMSAVTQRAEGITREAITVVTGYKRSTRDAYLLRLSNAGYVKEDAYGRVVALPGGIEWLGSDYKPLPTGDALREHWLTTLPSGERRILQQLTDAYPSALERSTIDERTGFKRSTRDAYISRLLKRQLVSEHASGGVVASAELFS